ncbi:hypothetical protein SBRCBS47491_003648 [Sporothrix bragantina]|uniref:Uncharacterized protein n=1 Tax=Sporothrix bragantina TaxID=671064 RepID=A0ABP0BH67_9PEZI
MWETGDAKHKVEEYNAIRSPTIAEYASSVGAYKEWTHTCIALHQIAGHITASQVESAATGLADLIRLLIKNAHRMGLLSQSLNEESCMPPSKHVALYYKQVFWAKFVALAFAVFSEHALRVDLVTGDSDWAKSVPEAAVMEALIIPDRSQTPTPTPLTGRVFRLDGFLSLDNMIPEYWWRYGRNLDTAWDEFLNKFCERQSMSPIYNEVETETTHEPHPAISRLQDDPVESEYEGYNTYRDFGIIEDLSLAYDDVSKVHVPLLTSMDEEIEEEVENKYQEETREDEGFGAFKGVTKSQLLANPSSLNLMSQFTAVRIRGGLQALANVIFGGIDGANELVAREDTESVLAREQLDMLQAMADDSFYGYERLLQWQPREGPRSHTGIRAMRQKLANIYRHPLELYSAVV